MRQNYRHLEETKKKISEAHKGKKYAEEFKKKLSGIHKKIEHPTSFKIGHMPWNKGLIGIQAKEKHPSWGRKQSKEEIEKRIKKIVNGGLLKGKNHPNWKGGITPVNIAIKESKEYKLWRETVFERDNYTCVWCGYRGKGLNADHIKPFSLFPELRFVIDNGRTLCRRCHEKTETFAGRATYGKKR